MLNIGFLVNNIFASAVIPDANSEPEVLAADTNWKLVYGFGLIF